MGGAPLLSIFPSASAFLSFSLLATPRHDVRHAGLRSRPRYAFERPHVSPLPYPGIFELGSCASSGTIRASSMEHGRLRARGVDSDGVLALLHQLGGLGRKCDGYSASVVRYMCVEVVCF